MRSRATGQGRIRGGRQAEQVGRIVRTRVFGFKTRRGWIVSIGALVLAGCAGTPARAPVAPPPAEPRWRQQPLSELPSPPTPRAGAFAALMQADFALAHNELNGAARGYARAARQFNDAGLAQRAFELAIATRNVPLGRQALARWQALGASLLQMESASLALALVAGDSSSAQGTLEQLESRGRQGWQAALRVLSRSQARPLAWSLLRRTATPATLPQHDPALWLACGQVGLAWGHADYALTLARALRMQTHVAVAYAWLSELELHVGDAAAAARTLDDGLRRHPNDRTLRLARASQLASSMPAEAMRLLARGPQDHDTYAMRAAIAARAEDRGAMRALFAQIAQLPAGRRRSEAYLMGQLAEWLAEPGVAMKWYASVPVDSRDGFAASLRRAVLLDQVGHARQARLLAADLAEQSFDDAQRYRQAAIVQAELAYRAGDYGAAVAAYNRVLLFNPHAWHLVYARGLVLAEAGRTDEAIRDFRAVLAAKPDDADVLNALGYTLADANRDLPEAKVLLLRALAKQPSNAAIVDSWGWLNYRMGNYVEAVVALEKAWHLGRSAEIGAHLALALKASGHLVHARWILRQATKLDPHNRVVQAAWREIGP